MNRTLSKLGPFKRQARMIATTTLRQIITIYKWFFIIFRWDRSRETCNCRISKRKTTYISWHFQEHWHHHNPCSQHNIVLYRRTGWSRYKHGGCNQFRMEYHQAKYCNYNRSSYIDHAYDVDTKEIEVWDKHIFPFHMFFNWELDTANLTSSIHKLYRYRHKSTSIDYFHFDFAEHCTRL